MILLHTGLRTPYDRIDGSISDPGLAQTLGAALLLERLENADAWKAFSKSSVALGLRKANRYGSAFNEVAEALQQQGLRTNYMGISQPARSVGSNEVVQPLTVAQWQAQSQSQTQFQAKALACRHISSARPKTMSLLGQTVVDYHAARTASLPRLIPLELSYSPHAETHDTAALEMVAHLEATPRVVTLSEALSLSGISAIQLQDMVFKSLWVAGFLKWVGLTANIDLASGKMTWGVDRDEQLLLVEGGNLSCLIPSAAEVNALAGHLLLATSCLPA